MKARNLKISVSFYPVLVLASLITLYFLPKFADPFNSIKLYFLIVSVPILFIYYNGKIHFAVRNNSITKVLAIMLLAFLLTFFVMSLLTDQIYTAFFGEIQRQTGFLAYFGFVLFMFLSALIFRLENFTQFINVFIGLSIIYVVYSLMQATGNDIFKWNNQYNSIIGTLGNPNFAAAFMAMLAVCSFGAFFVFKSSLFLRFFELFLMFGLVACIYLSEARQGLISFLLGVFTICIVLVYRWNKLWGHIFSIFLSLVIFISILGMLQIGPFEKYLYKDSVSLRGYYWRAGLAMLQANPISGVGIERYGANFKLLREDAYPLKYGFDLISTNAHNNYIQFFATGGALLGTIYLLLNLLIGAAGVYSILKSKGSNQLKVTTIYAIWIGFQAQAVVSIDNIGLTIWGWIVGGIVIGTASEVYLSNNQKSSTNLLIQSNQRPNYNSFLGIFLYFILIVSLVGVVFLSKSESSTYNIRNIYNPDNANNLPVLKDLGIELLADPLAQPAYKLEIASYLIQSGYEDIGWNELKSLVRKDPTSPVFSLQLANMFEYKGQYQDAIKLRNKIRVIDPMNAKNILQLARLYKTLGDSANATAMLAWLNSKAKNSEEAKIANLEIVF